MKGMGGLREDSLDGGERLSGKVTLLGLGFLEGWMLTAPSVQGWIGTLSVHAVLGTSKEVQASNGSKAKACRWKEGLGPREAVAVPSACKRPVWTLIVGPDKAIRLKM